MYDHMSLKSLALYYFRELCASNPLANGEFTADSFPRPSVERMQELSNEYTKEEVYQA